MGRRATRHVDRYTFDLTETFDNDLSRAELGLELWRRFARTHALLARVRERTAAAESISDGADGD